MISTTDILRPGLAAGELTALPLPSKRHAGSRIASTDDLGFRNLMTSGSANTFTIPSDAELRATGQVSYPLGAAYLITQYGAGQVTIAGGSGVTLRSESSMVNISAQYLSVIAHNIGPDEWLLEGKLA